MSAARVERRLAAILAADVAGYSRLMQQDEAGTIARLKVLRRELIEPVLGRLDGRFVDLKGDGAIVEFHSAVAAVEAAVEIQRAVAAHEAGRPEDERILYRIGINLGEVVVDGPDIYGDGVNVAARIESLCEPGGVWLAARVHDQVKGKIEVAFEPTGLHRVKNISEPVEAWRVRLDGVPSERTSRRPGRSGHPWWSRPALAACVAGLVVLLAAGVGWHWWSSEQAVVGGKPGIAVLPFENMGGDAATGRLADGISEDIITDLARFRSLDVIARNSTFVYKGKPIDVRQVGKDLGVSYVLEGSIQRQGERIRVTAQLIDTRSDAHVWAERWDRPVDDVFAVQTEVAERVAAAIGGDLTMGMISKNELQRAKRMRPNDLRAYDYFQLGKESKATVSNIAQGIEYLNKAIELDPTLGRAYSVRGWLHNFSIMFGAEAGPALRQMEADNEKAVALDPQDPESLASLAFVRIYQGRYAEAEAALHASLQMGPSNVHVLILAASGLALIGKAQEGAEYADRAIKLDPRMTSANLGGAKDAYFVARRYEDTIAAINRMPEKERSRDSWVFLTSSLARLGRTTEHTEAKAKTLRAFPTVSAERMLNEDYVFARKEDENRFVEDFTFADLPVCMSVDELATFPSPKRLPECDAERAKAALPKS
jgi:TolB-like protein/class 3 adenylate cyclase/Tfp pilus assembly protein PilF